MKTVSQIDCHLSSPCGRARYISSSAAPYVLIVTLAITSPDSSHEKMNSCPDRSKSFWFKYRIGSDRYSSHVGLRWPELGGGRLSDPDRNHVEIGTVLPSTQTPVPETAAQFKISKKSTSITTIGPHHEENNVTSFASLGTFFLY